MFMDIFFMLLQEFNKFFFIFITQFFEFRFFYFQFSQGRDDEVITTGFIPHKHIKWCCRSALLLITVKFKSASMWMPKEQLLKVLFIPMIRIDNWSCFSEVFFKVLDRETMTVLSSKAETRNLRHIDTSCTNLRSYFSKNLKSSKHLL